MSTVTGIGIIIHVDPTMQLTQDMLVGIRRGATSYMQCLFTPQEARAFGKNSLFWNIPYMRAQYGFVPEPFQIHEGVLYIHYHPTAVPLFKDLQHA
jgi:hypothetical protein